MADVWRVAESVNIQRHHLLQYRSAQGSAITYIHTYIEIF